MQVQQLLKSATFKRLPEFFQTHEIFKKIKRIEKPFPEMGLTNILEKCDATFDDNIDNKQLYIGFTSQGVQGVWDLATMSMRGVCSCMHWNNTVHSKHLIGSITEPFLGMVYITDKSTTPYGNRFIRRALVRLLYCTEDHKPYIFIERPYVDTGNTNPHKYINREAEPTKILEIFANFLRQKTTTSVLTSRIRNLYYIPYSTSSTYLATLNQHSLSDAILYYTNDVKNSFITTFMKQD